MNSDSNNIVPKKRETMRTDRTLGPLNRRRLSDWSQTGSQGKKVQYPSKRSKTPESKTPNAFPVWINPQARLVDLTHEIPPQDIQAGAFILAALIPYSPKKNP